MLHMVKNYLANQRQGTQSARTRAEVSGGGKKPWRQKGTGRARQGSTRAPQWTHGGIVFAPKPRDYSYTVNKKVRRLAMKSAFSSKVQDNELVVLDSIALDEYKTKTMAAMLKAVGSEKKALIVLSEKNDKIVASVANIPGVKTAFVNTLNVYDILNADKSSSSRMPSLRLRRCMRDDSSGHCNPPDYHGEKHERDRDEKVHFRSCERCDQD